MEHPGRRRDEAASARPQAGSTGSLGARPRVQACRRLRWRRGRPWRNRGTCRRPNGRPPNGHHGRACHDNYNNRWTRRNHNCWPHHHDYNDRRTPYYRDCRSRYHRGRRPHHRRNCRRRYCRCRCCRSYGDCGDGGGWASRCGREHSQGNNRQPFGDQPSCAQGNNRACHQDRLSRSYSP